MRAFTIGKTILKNIFNRPATLMYPKIKREFSLKSRGRIIIDIEKCIFCSICQKKCPTDAIRVAKSERTWQIDRLRCITCNYCVDACPKKCLSMRGNYSPPQVERSIDSFRCV